MDDVERWLLTAEERGNPATSLPAYTEGNLVEPLDALDEPVEVGDAVHERLDEVALGVRGQRRRRVAALLAGQQPALDVVHPVITAFRRWGRNHGRPRGRR